MYLTKRFALMMIAALLLFAIGCSGSSVPTLPGEHADTDSIPVIGLSQAGDTFSATGIMGAYEVNVDLETMNVDLVAKRTPTVGEGYIVSGIGFFTMAPCANCLTFAGISWTPENYVKLDFMIKHPFAPGNPSQPPTAINRLDLDVFDLAAVIAPSAASTTNFTGLGVEVPAGIVNASSWTKELSPLLGGDMLLPYFLVVDDNLDGANTNNKFAMGAQKEFSTWFDPVGGISFDMYLTMGYGASARKMQRLTPKYFIPEFNRNAAWKVVAEPPQGDDVPTQDNTWKDDDNTTAFDVNVYVYDWQIGATVWDGSGNYEDANTAHIFAASGVASIEVEIPGVSGGVQSVSSPVAVSGTGTPNSPALFKVPVTNAQTAAAGEYVGLVRVIDQRIPGVWDNDGRDFLIDTPDGIALNNYNLTEYATYNAFIATVVPSCGPIVGSIVSPTCPVTGAGDGAMINFTVTAESLNGGDPIVLYEVDHDYDGITFNSSASNTTGEFTGVGPFTVPAPCEDNIPYSFTVAFRATDSCEVPNTTIFATCEVTVNNCCVNQELLWDFSACSAVSYTCGGWEAGGCGLPNTDLYGWGSFNFGCYAAGAEACEGISSPNITSGGDGLGCGWLTDTYDQADYNLVSPTITLPASGDGRLDFDHCNAFGSGGVEFRVYISTDGCTGPWTELWSDDTVNGCFQSYTSLSDYSGTNVKFRFQYFSPIARFDGGSCGNAGVVIDNVKITGCFSGDLEEN